MNEFETIIIETWYQPLLHAKAQTNFQDEKSGEYRISTEMWLNVEEQTLEPLNEKITFNITHTIRDAIRERI